MQERQRRDSKAMSAPVGITNSTTAGNMGYTFSNKNRSTTTMDQGQI